MATSMSSGHDDLHVTIRRSCQRPLPLLLLLPLLTGLPLANATLAIAREPPGGGHHALDWCHLRHRLGRFVGVAHDHPAAMTLRHLVGNKGSLKIVEAIPASGTVVPPVTVVVTKTPGAAGVVADLAIRTKSQWRQRGLRLHKTAAMRKQ